MKCALCKKAFKLDSEVVQIQRFDITHRGDRVVPTERYIHLFHLVSSGDPR